MPKITLARNAAWPTLPLFLGSRGWFPFSVGCNIQRWKLTSGTEVILDLLILSLLDSERGREGEIKREKGCKGHLPIPKVTV